MPEWPEGIPNPHPHPVGSPPDGLTPWEREHLDHHRAEEALLTEIERLRADLSATYQEATRAARESVSDLQALLAVRDAAQAVCFGDGSLRSLANVLQGLPEHLRGQA